MLQSNNMLVPEGVGRQQRSRGTCYVDEPPFGFFVTGSSIKPMNGVYIRRNAPRSLKREGEDVLLYYRGASSKRNHRRRWQKFYLKEDFDIPIFQRLFVLFKMKFAADMRRYWFPDVKTRIWSPLPRTVSPVAVE